MNKDKYINLNKIGYRNACNLYQNICSTILTSCMRNRELDFKFWRAIYSFLKAFTDAKVEITDKDATVEIEGITTVITITGECKVNSSLSHKDITKYLIDNIKSENDIDRLYNLAQYIYANE